MTQLTKQKRMELRELANGASKGPYELCHHPKSEEDDKSCCCGYRGGIWAQGNFVLCEMVVYDPPEQEMTPRFERPQEIKNAHYLAAVSPDVVISLLDQFEELIAASLESLKFSDCEGECTSEVCPHNKLLKLLNHYGKGRV